MSRKWLRISIALAAICICVIVGFVNSNNLRSLVLHRYSFLPEIPYSITKTDEILVSSCSQDASLCEAVPLSIVDGEKVAALLNGAVAERRQERLGNGPFILLWSVQNNNQEIIATMYPCEGIFLEGYLLDTHLSEMEGHSYVVYLLGRSRQNNLWNIFKEYGIRKSVCK